MSDLDTVASGGLNIRFFLTEGLGASGQSETGSASLLSIQAGVCVLFASIYRENNFFLQRETHSSRSPCTLTNGAVVHSTVSGPT